MIDIQSIHVSNRGAELTSLRANNREYLWQGDPSYWGRRAPILFPIVGRLADDKLRINGEEYHMSQHGFARDADFTPHQFNTSFDPLNGFRLLPNNDPIFMQLVNDGSFSNYPYDFLLNVCYALFENNLEVKWEVKNTCGKTMYFQIGVHPAFLLPDYDASDDVHGYLRCYNHEGQNVLPVSNSRLVNGLRQRTDNRVLSDGQSLIPITNHTFADDALLLESGDIASIALVDNQGVEVLRVNCPQADAFGLWAPNKPGCPFVCIEPWCGAADSEGFCNEISEREYIHSLSPQETFYFDYSISILN